MKTLATILFAISVFACMAEPIHAGSGSEGTACSNQVLLATGRIVIPEIEFRNTRIRDAVEFLVKAALTNDPQKKGVNIVITPAAEESSTNTVGRVQTPYVTLSCRFITLRNALKILASLTGLECYVKDSVVMVMAGDEPESELITRVFSIEPQIAEWYPVAASTTTNAVGGPSCSTDVTTWFASMGVRWPRGSQASYYRSCSRLVVVNTADNLRVIESILREINLVPKQVQITAQFIKFDLTNITVAVSGKPDAGMIMGLWTNGCGRLISAPTVITRSGTEATVKGVSEVIYPTSYDSVIKGSNTLGGIQCEEGVPQDFATREVGVILNVLPEVPSVGEYVYLTLKPSFVENPTWNDYGYAVPIGEDDCTYVPMEQPFFHVYTAESQFMVADGQSVLAFGGVPTSDGKGLVYCIVTVRLLGSDGKSMHSEEEPYRPAAVRL